MPCGTSGCHDTKNGLVLRWSNKNVISAVSEKVEIYPIQKAKRWSRSHGTRVEYPAILDQTIQDDHRWDWLGGSKIDKCHPAIHSEKWWYIIFACCFNLCIHHAWHPHMLIQKALNKPTDLFSICCLIGKVFFACGLCPLSPGYPEGFAASRH